MCAKKKNLCSTNIYFKMSSFKMETLKLMEKISMAVTCTYRLSKCTWCFQFWKVFLWKCNHFECWEWNDGLQNKSINAFSFFGNMLWMFNLHTFNIVKIWKMHELHCVMCMQRKLSKISSSITKIFLHQCKIKKNVYAYSTCIYQLWFI